jgi:Nickel/cobalt transporter regulator
MRTFIFAALLAGAAIPAFAAGQDQDSGRRHGLTVRNAQRMETRSEERSERSADRPQPQSNVEARPQINPPQSPDRPQSIDRARPLEVRREAPLATAVDRAERQENREALRRSREVGGEAQVDRPAHNFEPRMVRAPGQGAEAPGVERTAGGNSIRERRLRDRSESSAVVEHRTPGGATGATIEERNVRRAPSMREQPGGDLVQQRRSVPRVFEPAERRISRTPAFGTEPPAPRTAASRSAHPGRAWRTNWRDDHRYNWHDWRHRHRSNFHLGLYYDPYGWDYFHYCVGWRLWPSYYRSSFWLDDPWQYRLPPAYGPYRWVRYHYDAVLVNIYTGEVADIVYNFFW